MSIIYEPKGRAQEYCKLAANLYSGCSHACEYCYVNKALNVDKQKFNQNDKPRKDIIHNFLHISRKNARKKYGYGL